MNNRDEEKRGREIGHAKRSEAVYSSLYGGIVSGGVQPGERLRQGKLADDLGVSQATVREALQRLVSVGLAETIPRKGVRVCDIPAEDLRDIYRLRLIVEPLAWEAASPLVTPREIAAMRELLPRSVVGPDPASVVTAHEINREFHMIPIRASGRRYLIKVMTDIFQLNNAYHRLLRQPPQSLARDRERNLREHAGLIEALEKSDGILVARLVRNHIEQAMRERLAIER